MAVGVPTLRCTELGSSPVEEGSVATCSQKCLSLMNFFNEKDLKIEKVPLSSNVVEFYT